MKDYCPTCDGPDGGDLWTDCPTCGRPAGLTPEAGRAFWIETLMRLWGLPREAATAMDVELVDLGDQLRKGEWSYDRRES